MFLWGYFCLQLFETVQPGIDASWPHCKCMQLQRTVHKRVCQSTLWLWWHWPLVLAGSRQLIRNKKPWLTCFCLIHTLLNTKVQVWRYGDCNCATSYSVDPHAHLSSILCRKIGSSFACTRVKCQWWKRGRGGSSCDINPDREKTCLAQNKENITCSP